MESPRARSLSSLSAAEPTAVSADAMAELDRRYRLPLLKFFQRRGCTAALAEDLTQDVFLKVVAYQRASEIKNLQSFVFRTAANRLRDSARSTRRWSTSSLEDAGGARESAPLLVEFITPERILQGRQDVEVVTQAFAELDVRTQRIFLMNRVERLRHRDIADHLNLSVSLVEKTLRTAQQLLELKYARQRLRKDGRGSEAFAVTLAALAEAPA
jgi:RNA polymerase sigma factor (sigma-70 family)